MKEILVAALLGLISSGAQALDPTRAISQYAHTAWRNRDGYFSSAPSAITQTKDGYIWVGTIGGLLRFDGVRFTPWTPPKDGPTLPTATIVSLFASRDGSLWIGTALGLALWSNGKLSNYSDRSGHINSIAEDPKGGIWIARTRVQDGRGPICEVVGSNLRCYGRADGIPLPQGQALAIDSSGNFWIGYEGAMVRWRHDSGRTFRPLTTLRNAGAGADSLATGRDGEVWVGFFGAGHGLGLQRFEKKLWRPVNVGAFNGSSLKVSSLFSDSADTLWVGTDSDGIYRIRGNTVEHFNTSDGLSGDHVQDFFEDEEHNIWVATASGIDCFRDLPVVSFTKREGLTADNVHSVYAAQDGKIWVGNVGALDLIRNGAVSSIQREQGLPGAQVTGLLLDHSGRLWLGVDDGLYLYQRGHFRPIQDRDRKPSGLLTHLAEDVDGSIWAVNQGATHRLLHIRGDVIAEQYPAEKLRGLAADPHGGVWSNLSDAIAHRQNGVQQLLKMPPGIHIDYISDIVSDPRGALWASIRQGVLLFDGDKAQLLGAKNGLPCPSHGSLIFDKQGALWLTQKCGTVKIERNSLENWKRHPEARVSTLLLDVYDGVQIGFSDFQPSASLGRDGRLWFVTGSEVQMIDPDHLHINTVPPPVHVEQLIANHKEVAVSSSIYLRPLTRDIEIDYSALSFVVPQRVRFRYKLEGHDPEWQDSGTRRSAFYTNLPPGAYKFQVTACNNDGVWNEVGAHLNFWIAPAWYQTNWFWAACVGAFLILIRGLYQLRIRQMQRQFNVRLEARVNERTRIARELHDTLLQSLHGLMFEFQAARNMFHKRPEEALQVLDSAITGTEEAISESQDAIENLRSTATPQADLAQKVKIVGEELVTSRHSDHEPPTFGLTVEGRQKALTAVIRDEAFRIAREALRNAFRHAQAHRIEAEILYAEDELRIRVRDDGNGMAPRVLAEGGRPGHWGLPGVRERAEQIGAKLDVWSEAGAGTEVQLSVPASVAYEPNSRRSKSGMFHRNGNHD